MTTFENAANDLRELADKLEATAKASALPNEQNLDLALAWQRLRAVVLADRHISITLKQDQFDGESRVVNQWCVYVQNVASFNGATLEEAVDKMMNKLRAPAPQPENPIASAQEACAPMCQPAF